MKVTKFKNWSEIGTYWKMNFKDEGKNYLLKHRCGADQNESDSVELFVRDTDREMTCLGRIYKYDSVLFNQFATDTYYMHGHRGNVVYSRDINFGAIKAAITYVTGKGL